MWQIERAQGFLGLTDTSWARVVLRKTSVPECHHIIVAFVSPFVFCLQLHRLECYIQAGIPVDASFIQLRNRVFLELRKLGFLSSCTSGVERLLDKQFLIMWVPHPA